MVMGKGNVTETYYEMNNPIVRESQKLFFSAQLLRSPQLDMQGSRGEIDEDRQRKGKTTNIVSDNDKSTTRAFVDI